MSPLLGSTGGSSEYSYRGTLDDWPNDFATALAAQNPPTLIDPGIPITATLTITGLNYKARLITDHPNVTVRVTSEFGVAVTDGREVYAARRPTDPPLLIRDQSVISIRLQPTSGTLGDFDKNYIVPVFIGKRNGTWQSKTRSIDQTPNSFSFSPLIDQQLGITTTSTIIPPVTIAGLENGFSFPISVVANQVGGNVSYFKNGVEFTTSSTVVNGDLIYLSTLTPNTYATPRTFTVQVGNFTTSWGILTRDAVSTITPFSFTSIASANQTGFGYTSGFVTISGADIGIGLPVSMTGGSFQILDSNGNPRYPAPPAPPPYWQTSPSTAFNGDKINVRVFSATIPPNWSTTTSGILTVSNQSATFNVTTRPEPINTIPLDINNTFTDLTGLTLPSTSQDRGIIVQSNAITLSGMSPAGATGTASISGSTAPTGVNITPQFNVNGSATWISPPTTAAVKNGDTIRLRMTTPNIDGSNGDSTSTITFRIDGTSTANSPATPPENPEGFVSNPGFVTDIWNVQTKSRNCTIILPTITSNIGVATNTSISKIITFPSSNWENECRMTVSTNLGTFTRRGVGGGTVVNATDLLNVLPTETLTLTVTSSSVYDTPITATITITNNTVPNITPKDQKTVGWTVRTAPNNTPASVTLQISANSVEVGSPITLTWNTTNCTSIRSVSGPGWTVVPTSLSGNVTLNAPTTAGPVAYALIAYANPSASNAIPGFPTTPGALPSDAGGYYASDTRPLTVNENTSPLFTDTADPAIVDFTTQLNVAPTVLSDLSPKTYRSNILRVSDISVLLTARIDALLSSPGSNMIVNGATPAPNSLNIGVGTTIRLVASAAQIDGTTPAGYNTETSALVRFYYGTPEVEVANKRFSIKTQLCSAFSYTVRFPLTGGTNFVILPYYNGYKWQNLDGTSSVSGSLLKARDVTISGSISGNASAYYGPLVTPLVPIPGINYGRFSGSQTVDIGWQELIDAIWNTHIQVRQRPPTEEFITNVLQSFTPYNLLWTNMTSFITIFLTPLAADPTSGPGGGSPVRNTAIDILDVPCERVIKTGAYTLSGGNYV